MPETCERPEGGEPGDLVGVDCAARVCAIVTGGGMGEGADGGGGASVI